MFLLFIILAVIGFSISLYAYMVERKIRKVPTYKPVCDISDWVSCTKPMKSPYSDLFFVSNALVGMIFYIVIAILAVLNAIALLLVASIVACTVSSALAYLLYFKIKALCILCTSLYIINAILLFLSIKNFFLH